jgi:hypothetical protein
MMHLATNSATSFFMPSHQYSLFKIKTGITDVDLSEEELISTTSECYDTYEIPAEVKFDGE